MANFTVTASGGFVAPNGTPWTMRGLNAGVQDALQGFGNVLKDYPGLTAIRLNCDSGNDSAASIAQVVQEYTAAGIVVEVEDHSGNGDNVAWYQQMATMFKGNSLVFLETPNEPSANAATTAQNQIGIINAIRAAGFANPIGLQPVGGYDQSNIPTVTAAVGTAGLFATPHIYYGVNDPNGAEQYVQSEIQGALQKGLFPAIDEFGNALDGYTADPQGMTVITSVLAANEAGQAGAVFWAMDNGNHPDGADSAFLNSAGTQLTPVGVDIQPWLSQTTGTLTGGGTTGGGTTTPPTTPVLITPGIGSFKDAASNLYTVAANGDADENGNLMNGGTGTGALELAKGIIYGQDSASKTWYTWNQSTWTQAASAPPAITVTTPPVTPPNQPVLITPGVGSFKDMAGNVYTVSTTGDADENGNLMNGGTGTGALELANGVIYGQDATNKQWWSWNQTTWTQAASAPPTVSVPPGGGTTTPPVVTNPAPVTTGTGSDSLVLSISEDAYQGNAQFTVSVDGKQLAGTFTTTASHAAGASQSFTFNGDWAPGAHAVAVNFLNDANGGTAATDRNLYVNGISYDGKATGQTAALMAGGPKGFSVTDSTAIPSPAIGSGSDTMILNVSEDAYQGNAQFTVSVDGKQLGSTFTATALHAATASQNFTFKGDFGTGQHAVAVNFLNDAYGGSSATDRNLYVNGISYNGTATGQSAVLGVTGPQAFTVSGGTTPSVSETGDHGSLAKTLSQTGSYTVGGDTFVLTAGNAAAVTLGTGTSQIKFIGASSATLTGGSGQATVTADAGTNKFVAGTDTLDVTGGGGKDAYVFHANGGLLKLEDFSIAKGDTLTVDKALQGAMQQASDGQGGTMITFGAGATHGVDIHGMATMPTTNVLWA
jgi:hypothetical protein